MVRVSVFLRRDQLDALRSQQRRTGVVQAEQIRRALDAALGLKPSAQRGRR
jgi:vacuolar-type H+-ATPase subunit I/STV1